MNNSFNDPISEFKTIEEISELADCSSVEGIMTIVAHKEKEHEK